jgi:type III secretion protein V
MDINHAQGGPRIAFARTLEWLHRFGARSDAVVAIIVALVVFMMVLPLPTPVIDALVALNIATALLLIALSLYLPNAVAFSSFPAVLLLTTLFRLGLEISTSRSILMHADAGAIVETFGRFVAGDHVVVGAIVFFIVAVVQFVVITKGAERVAEVAARFSLDSMPGRQMAIDADVRAGLARPDMVAHLRAELARESRMHGAMDGAMKFVKGDAVAGFVIVIVNLTAGMAIGVVYKDMTVGEALHRYAVLTIGNGLMAQIPALLISIAAAVLITRGGEAQTPQGTTLGREVLGQMRAAPAAWIVAGTVAAAFAAVPGMPWIAFALVSASMLGFGALGLRRERAGVDSRRKGEPEMHPDSPIPDECDMRQIVPIRPIVVFISEHMAGDERFARFERAARRARNRLVLHHGMTVPNIDIQRVRRLEGDAYEVAIHEVVAADGRFHCDSLCVREEAISDDALRVHAVAQRYPLIAKAVWIERERWIDAGALASGIGAVDYFERLVTQVLHRHAARFVGIHEAQLVFGWLQRETPAAAKELAQVMPLPRFAEVLRLLVGERVSIRNVRVIVETLVSWAPREKDTAMLAEHVRLALQAQICQEFARDGILHAVLVDRALEDTLRASLQQSAQGWTFAIDPETAGHLLTRAAELCRPPDEHGATPVVLTAQDLRRPLRLLLRDEVFDAYVLAYTELTPTQRVRAVGTISRDAA